MTGRPAAHPDSHSAKGQLHIVMGHEHLIRGIPEEPHGRLDALTAQIHHGLWLQEENGDTRERKFCPGRLELLLPVPGAAERFTIQEHPPGVMTSPGVSRTGVSEENEQLWVFVGGHTHL